MKNAEKAIVENGTPIAGTVTAAAAGTSIGGAAMGSADNASGARDDVRDRHPSRPTVSPRISAPRGEDVKDGIMIAAFLNSKGEKNMSENMNVQATSRADVADILALLGSARRVALSAHTYPDGDAVGSCLAMAAFLRAMGKDAAVVLPRKDVGPVRALDGFADIVNPGDFDFSVPPDLFVCLDCADPSRICDERLAALVGKVPTLNVDHHGKKLFGDLNYVVKDASSTGELVFDIATAAGWPINRPTAEALWCAILTDTSRFTSPATTPSTLRAAAALAEKGVRIAWLAEQLYQREPFHAFDLRRRATNSLDRWFDGRVASIALSTDDFAETGCQKQDGETFPDIPNSLEGVQLAIFFYPFPVTDPSHTRISARSRPGSPVTAKDLATHFGGGGHEHSAAATPALSISETKQAAREWLASVFNA